MRQEIKRGLILIGFYVCWVLRTVGWAWLSGNDSDALGATVLSFIVFGVVLLPWPAIVYLVGRGIHHRQWVPVVTAGWLAVLTVASSEALSAKVAPFIPLLTILTGWQVAGLFVKSTTRSTAWWVTGVSIVVTGLCLLTPVTAGRLFVAGYASPVQAFTASSSSDREGQVTSYNFNVTEVSLIPTQTNPKLSVDVHRLGWVYYPTEEQWWVV
ncbi:hypothetical protein [Levilactobacillus humaensis]|uniref:hypothetical protein n=1 Tax=Levilactobacillus humaensis TaxID=2950375 RepID=UPI0021C4921A|nr:hypothetical protein [Levilactobacillus humaensis]